MANSTGFSSELYLSRDQIRNQIIDYLKTHLELENVDLTKSSFLSYIVNLFSTLTSNLLFYQSSVYREFFLTKAQLPESVYNLAAFLGYDPGTADNATANLLVKIPFGFSSSNVTFTFPENFKFYANDVQFSTYYSAEVNVFNNSDATVTIRELVDREGGKVPKVYDIPVNIDTTADNEFSFVLPVRQVKEQVQEFQVDSDLKKFQFTTIDVPIDGKLADLTVELRPPGSSGWQLYEEYSSLYLMSSDTYGYVYQRTAEGIKIFFGNGLMGVQPEPGSTVRVMLSITKGSEGNVIAGSITNGDRIYVVDNGETTILNYSVVNAYPATGGKDEESLEEIRSNAIANIQSMNRLVSESDYLNLNELKEKYIETNIINDIYPFMKRSDLKVNEINLYTVLNYGDEIIKSRSIYDKFNINETIPRGTRLDFENDTFVTLFDITIDSLNEAAYYDYVIRTVNLTPLLIRTYDQDYDLTTNNLEISKEMDQIIFKLDYRTSEPDFDQATCQMEIIETGEIFNLTNDDTNKQFKLTISPYTLIATGTLTYYFDISDPDDNLIGTYQVETMIRQNLNEIMLSDAIAEDSTSIIVYDIPVIQEDCYNQLDLKVFETTVLQELISSFYTLNNYRMLTDFINMKFTNTYGTLYGMLSNQPTEPQVIDIVNELPDSASDGDRYIIEDTNEIVTFQDSTSYISVEPTTNDIVYVVNKAQNYIFNFNGRRWVSPVYEIPLIVELEVFPTQAYSGTVNELINSVKDTLISAFEDRFGPNSSIFRAEIIRVVQEMEEVDNCSLIKPESDIFFSFEESRWTQKELLEYVPEYVYFDKDSIRVRVV